MESKENMENLIAISAGSALARWVHILDWLGWRLLLWRDVPDFLWAPPKIKEAGEKR